MPQKTGRIVSRRNPFRNTPCPDCGSLIKVGQRQGLWFADDLWVCMQCWHFRARDNAKAKAETAEPLAVTIDLHNVYFEWEASGT